MFMAIGATMVGTASNIKLFTIILFITSGCDHIKNFLAYSCNFEFDS